MDLLSHAVMLTEEVPLNVGTDENALSMRSASAPLEEQGEEEGEDEVVEEGGEEEGGGKSSDKKLPSPHTDEALAAISNGLELANYLKKIPTNRCVWGVSLVMTRVTKLLMKLKPGPFENKPYFQNFTTFKTLLENYKNNKEPSSIVFGVIISLQREDECFGMVLRAIQNKRMPTIVAAPSDANSGSVVSNRYALVAHVLIHPEAQKDINAYHEKCPKGMKPQDLTEGMIAKINEKAIVIKNWCETLRGVVSNPFKQEWSCLKMINPSMGEIKDLAQLKGIMTDIKSTYTDLKTRLETSGRNENGVILDSKALEFCQQGKTTNLSKCYSDGYIYSWKSYMHHVVFILKCR